MLDHNFQYTFFGKVYPERTNVTIPELAAKLEPHDGEISGYLRFSITLSQISAVFLCENLGSNVYSLKNLVEEGIRSALDALGYFLGCGYDLEISQMVDSTGSKPVVFGVGIPIIKDSAPQGGVTFETIIRLLAEPRGKYLRICLADLREAIRAPKDTAFFCYRGIESLRHFFVSEKTGAKDVKDSWKMFREELGVERIDIDKIKDLSDPVRHGEGRGISDEERGVVFQLTWEIVNKFVKYGNANYQRTW